MVEKPNVEVEDPAKRPSLEDQGRGPAERAVLGTSPATSLTRMVLFALLFIVGFGTLFFFLNQ
jgi:hypothetical protein